MSPAVSLTPSGLVHAQYMHRSLQSRSKMIKLILRPADCAALKGCAHRRHSLLLCNAEPDNGGSKGVLTQRRNRVTVEQLGITVPKKKPPPQEPPPPPRAPPPLIERIMAFLGVTAGFNGTLAVVIAYLTHVDPFGNWQWNLNDIALGLVLFSPLFLHDLLVMLPEWEPLGDSKALSSFLSSLTEAMQPTSSRQPPPAGGDATTSTDAGSSTTSGSVGPSNLGADAQEQPQSAASAPSSPAIPAGLAGSQLPVRDGATPGQVPAASWGKPRPRGWPSMLRFAMQRVQDKYTLENPGADLPLAAEGGILMINALAREMLYRGVVLALIAGWCTDRFYEAGAGDDMALLGLTLPTAQAGAWGAVTLVSTIGMAALLARAAQFISRGSRIAVLPVNSKGEIGSKGDAKVVSVANQKLVTSLALSQLIGGWRDVLEVVCACSTFVATGNLAATYVASVLSEALLSGLQRRSLQGYKQKVGKLHALNMQRVRELKQQHMARKLAAAKAKAANADPAQQQHSTDGDEPSSSTHTAAITKEEAQPHNGTSAAPLEHADTALGTVDEAAATTHSGVRSRKDASTSHHTDHAQHSNGAAAVQPPQAVASDDMASCSGPHDEQVPESEQLHHRATAITPGVPGAVGAAHDSRDDGDDVDAATSCGAASGTR